MDTMVCEKCGETVHADGSWQPLLYMKREADTFGPATFFIFGDTLLHQCVITDHFLSETSTSTFDGAEGRIEHFSRA